MLTAKQRERVTELRAALDESAKPLGDLDLLRWMFDELLAILLEEPGETTRKGTDHDAREA